jgi:hypothetical protein
MNRADADRWHAQLYQELQVERVPLDAAHP